jgi:hypothetical protein
MKKQSSPIRQGPKQRRGPAINQVTAPDNFDLMAKGQNLGRPWVGDVQISYPRLDAVAGARKVRPGRGIGAKVEISGRPNEIHRAPSNQRTAASWRVPAVHEDANKAYRAAVRYGDSDYIKPAKSPTGHKGEALKGTLRPTIGFTMRKDD